jgi:pimeloyl-ACP methyl ester carboxylesterase
MTFRYVSVSTHDSSSLNLLEWSGNGPPCLLVHGFADAASIWHDFALRIAARFRTLAMDLRGHGLSDWDAAGTYDKHLLLADLLRVVDSLGSESAILIGHSLGGELAIQVAATAPSRIGALVLVDVGPDASKSGVDGIWRDYLDMPRRYRALEDYTGWLADRRPLASRTLLHVLASHNLRQLDAGGFELRLDPALRALAPSDKSAEESGKYTDRKLWQALQRVACPTLLVRGVGSSVLSRDTARSMISNMDGRCLLTEVDMAGHSTMIDNPGGFHAAVAPFIEAHRLLDKQAGPQLTELPRYR